MFPVPDAYSPAAQGVHDEFPVPAAYLPASQGVHVVFAVPLLYVPFGQLTQVFPLKYFPGPQGSQSATAVILLVIFSFIPAAILLFSFIINILLYLYPLNLFPVLVGTLKLFTFDKHNPSLNHPNPYL